ncbi:FAD binding domain-containing protein [Streptomyces pseudovenezuelae]|uniref:Xanthine dehydrogenase YagS FAD-binding subunit n=1 Tax=Streptomyces pseudovenezuelae TaxID=67350 RepID=A0ABT6LNU7_9ACTN|nr:xanthine dehydrogenase family protein subunit M [Streptomyces pseudovenezuelae]MDH6217987.1 xanthine dehydrogenase YagS FAD-binding subunit [Streptomyces pseudovenezuelae]
MHPFAFSRVSTVTAALNAGARYGRYIAGGTTLVDLMRETVERPAHVVDINGLPYKDITVTRQGLHVGSLVRMSELAAHPEVRATYPLLSQALELGASAQLRNMASIGGNIMQRPRCPYFRDVHSACNRRDPGSGCDARHGDNRMQAILGTSTHCVATHPSDLAVALVALDAVIQVRGLDGTRSIPVQDFFLRPGDTLQDEHSLRPGEPITSLTVPAGAHTRRSGYLKVRDRQSYEFALASAAVALDIRGGVVRGARVAVGGVATVPWRLPKVEEALVGKRPGRRTWTDAAALAAEGAVPLSENAFKVRLVERTVRRQLMTIGGQ